MACNAWRRLDLRPPADLRAVCEFLNVELIYETPPNGSRGLYLLDGDRASIYVSPTMPRIGALRLILAHEIGHAILGTSGVLGACFVDEKLDGRETDPTEQEANAQASDWLLPEEKYSRFLETSRGVFTKCRVENFAEEAGINPGIVVGRLQHDSYMPYSSMRHYLTRVA
jgi:HTH-type transcriptional regulator/antitoxin HigA